MVFVFCGSVLEVHLLCFGVLFFCIYLVINSFVRGVRSVRFNSVINSFVRCLVSFVHSFFFSVLFSLS